MNPTETIKHLAATAAGQVTLANEDYLGGDYESAQSRLVQVGILLDRMRAIIRDTAAGID